MREGLGVGFHNTILTESPMMRAIVTPPVLPGEALAELRQWLGITTLREDAPLTALLRAALEVCEGFTGMTPLMLTGEEMLGSVTSWQALSTRPVQSIEAVYEVAANGTRSLLAPDRYAIELDPDGSGKVLLFDAPPGERFAVRFTAGLAATWAAMPEALRHGVIRLAAHQHRERESSGAGALPPASVAALWRPYRRMRLT